ncbi:TonB-dependent receptor [Cytophaga sp. FL35]|uniref:TonB-dependent receptor n=1 Tax=Cytophaga sp. FL35 TaxID=1904456 RepID=UPI00165343CC|nr:TonB-dependent receptor [Cytophaga sp. FL35]MBC7000247.1 TonB-dependent receptor [Cytophaga sp. FL35]
MKKRLNSAGRTSCLFKLQMKLSLLLLTVTIAMQANSTYSQKKITLDLENVTLSRVIDEIEANTDFKFIFNSETVNTNRVLSLRIRNGEINRVLNMVFKQSLIDYEIYRDKILLLPKKAGERAAMETKVAPPQQLEVSGTVTDEAGTPLAGVNIVEKGTGNGQISDFDGNYSISVAGRETVLVFSYLGFETKEVLVGDSTELNVTLKESAQGLEEVVVVGYGSVNRSDLTGSVSTVDAEEITALPTTDVQQALKGRSAGVRVTQNSGQPGSSVQIQIRGGNSYLGDNNPLYVVDGFPITGGIDFLNPSDIESIDILKDASATAIYGSRGANGVVMITTKKGKKGQRGVVDVQSYYGIQNVMKTYDMLNSRQFAELANVAAVNEGNTEPFDLNNLPNVYTNWQDEAFRAAPIQSHTLTFSGGSESSSYSASANYFEQEGIILNTGQKRGSVRLSMDNQVNDWIRLSANTVLTRSKTNRANVNNGNSGNNIWSATLQAPPTVAPFDADGNYSEIDFYDFSPVSIDNPLLYAEVKDEVFTSKVLGNIAVEFELADRLKLKVLGGTEQEFRERNFYSPSILKKRTPQGSATFNMFRGISYLNENTLSYDATIGEDDRLSAVAGFTAQTFRGKTNESSATGFTTDILQDNALGTAESTLPNSSDVSDWKLYSWLGRVNYSLNNKYLFTASVRADGSSRFGDNNKWGVFSSGSFAWRLSNEEFLSNWESLSDLKLRVGYGETGSTAINPYQSLNTLGEARTTFGNSDVVGFANVSAPNPDLKWETTAQMGAGIDASFLEGKYRFTIDYYKKNTNDLLAIIPLPGSTGFTSLVTNLGEIENTGMEFSAGATFGKSDFTWDVNAQLSFNKNEVITIGEDIFGGSLDIPFNSPVNIAREGEPLGMFYGFQEDGYDDQGVIQYKDLNGDGEVTNEDQTILGGPYPDFIYALNTTLNYKALSLNLFFEGSEGNELFWATGGYIANSFSTGGNQIVDVYNDYWTPQNTDAAYPAPSENRAQLRVSDRFVKDASYLRLKNIKLAYNIPVKNIQPDIAGLQVYLSAQNVFTVTDFPGLDPDVNTRGGAGDLRLGIAQTSYPSSRTITVGMNLKL